MRHRRDGQPAGGPRCAPQQRQSGEPSQERSGRRVPLILIACPQCDALSPWLSSGRGAQRETLRRGGRGGGVPGQRAGDAARRSASPAGTLMPCRLRSRPRQGQRGQASTRCRPALFGAESDAALRGLGAVPARRVPAAPLAWGRRLWRRDLSSHRVGVDPDRRGRLGCLRGGWFGCWGAVTGRRLAEPERSHPLRRSEQDTVAVDGARPGVRSSVDCVPVSHRVGGGFVDAACGRPQQRRGVAWWANRRLPFSPGPHLPVLSLRNTALSGNAVCGSVGRFGGALMAASIASRRRHLTTSATFQDLFRETRVSAGNSGSDSSSDRLLRRDRNARLCRRGHGGMPSRRRRARCPRCPRRRCRRCW